MERDREIKLTSKICRKGKEIEEKTKEKKWIDAPWERNIKTVLEERVSSKNVATYILHVGQ